jgi:hypothetical protein
MFQQQPERAISVNLQVRVFGTDSIGKPFIQYVSARNLSRNGAVICGLDQILRVGDIVGVSLEQKKARFRIALAIPAAQGKAVDFELEMQDGQECPWKNLLDQAPGRSPSPRRRGVRHKVDIKLELRGEFTSVPIRVSATDVSSYGCYVERIIPFPVGTKMIVELGMENERLNTSAVVRGCDPGLGMGIEFMSMRDLQRDHFQSYLERLGNQTAFG